MISTEDKIITDYFKLPGFGAICYEAIASKSIFIREIITTFKSLSNFHYIIARKYVLSHKKVLTEISSLYEFAATENAQGQACVSASCSASFLFNNPSGAETSVSAEL